MNRTLLAATLLSLLVLAPLHVQAQAQKVAKLEEKTRLLEEDLEVVKEFIQEQSVTLGKLKKELEGLPQTVEANFKKLEPRFKALEEADQKMIQDLKKQQTTEAALETRVKAIEDDLAKRRIHFFGQLRIRPEFVTNVDNFNSSLDEDQNMFSTQRLRLGVETTPLPWLTGRFVLQDVRGWGVNDFTSADRSDPLRVHEAYLKTRIFPGFAELKLGRQEWEFGSKRMVSRSDWSQAGRSFDGADLTVVYENYLQLDLLVALVDERAPSDGTDSVFGGLYLTVPYITGLDFDGYFLYLKDDRDGARRNVGTVGVRAAGKLPVHKALFFDVEATLQFGTVTEGYELDAVTGDNDHFATAYHLEVGYDVPVQAVNPSVAVFFDAASGDGNTSPTHPDNDGHYGFIPLFPTKHAMLGKMDLWNLTNIWDLGGRLSAAPLKGLQVSMELHSMHLVSDTGALPRGNAVNSSLTTPIRTDLGTELDLWADYRLNENIAFGIGYSVLFPGGALEDQTPNYRMEEIADPDNPGETMDQLFKYPYGDPAHWLYLQADFTF